LKVLATALLLLCATCWGFSCFYKLGADVHVGRRGFGVGAVRGVLYFGLDEFPSTTSPWLSYDTSFSEDFFGEPSPWTPWFHFSHTIRAQDSYRELGVPLWATMGLAFWLLIGRGTPKEELAGFDVVQSASR
jgi:hypothetical protein